MKSKKSALLLSFTSLLLCFAMLAGSTFAWFTDTATTGVNKIQAGTLDVELLMYKKVNGESDYVNISKEKLPIFGSDESLVAQNDNLDTLWEPGKTQVAYLAIKNEGNLDLKYQVALNVTNPADGKDLYQVMQYAIAPDVKGTDPTLPAWTAGNSVTPGTQIVSGKNTTGAAPAGVKLLHGETHYFALLVHMDENADNRYQNGKVEFDLTVYAAQLNSENDSFGPNYDKDAEYPIDTWNGDSATDAELTAATDNTNKVVTVDSGKLLAALVKAVNNGNNYEGYTIKLTKNIDLNGIEWTPIGTKGTSNVFKGIFDGDGRTIKNLKISSGDCVAFFGAVENATVKNLTVEGNVNGKNAAGIVARVVGGATIENCVNRATINASDKAAGIVMYAQGSSSSDQYGPLSSDCVIKNCKNYGAVNANKIAAGGIYGWSGDESGKLKITDCENNGVVTATNTAQAGGIAGNCRVITVENCANNGTVTSAANAGGIVGKNDTKASTITSCKNTATVVGAEYKTGGIAGTFIGEIKNSSTTGNDVLVGTLGTTTTKDVNTIEMAAKTKIKISAFEGNISLKNVEIDVVNVFVGTGNREINLSNASVATLTLTGGKDAYGNYMAGNRTVLTRDDETSTIGAIVVNGQCKDATSFMYIYLNGICNNVVNHMTTADGTKGANICTFKTGTINNGIVNPLEGEKTKVEYTA